MNTEHAQCTCYTIYEDSSFAPSCTQDCLSQYIWFGSEWPCLTRPKAEQDTGAFFMCFHCADKSTLTRGDRASPPGPVLAGPCFWHPGPAKSPSYTSLKLLPPGCGAPNQAFQPTYMSFPHWERDSHGNHKAVAVKHEGEKWRWKSFLRFTQFWSTLHASMHCLLHCPYHFKILRAAPADPALQNTVSMWLYPPAGYARLLHPILGWIQREQALIFWAPDFLHQRIRG